MGAGVVRRNGSPPCHNDWSINALVRIGGSSSQQVCPLQEVHVEALLVSVRRHDIWGNTSKAT